MKDILEKLANGQLDIDQAEQLLKADNILELMILLSLILNAVREQVFQKQYFLQVKIMTI